MKALLVAALMPFVAHASTGAPDLAVNVGVKAVAAIGKHFASFSFDTTAIFGVQRPAINFTSPELRAMAANLAPAWLRVSGSLTDSVVFNMSGQIRDRLPEPTNMTLYYMSRAQWDSLTGLVHSANLSLVLGVSAKLGRQDHISDPGSAVWNSSNAAYLLDYVMQHPRGAPVALELGNENNCFNKSAQCTNISALQLVEEYRELASMIRARAPRLELWGPDPSITGDVFGQCVTPEYWGTKDLLGQFAEFFDLGGGAFTNRTTWHYYPQFQGNKTSSAQLVLSDEYQRRIEVYEPNATRATRRHDPSRPVIVGETSSFWGGGLDGVSNRFASGFWLVGQLGYLATRGYDAMIRQDFAGGDYGLVDMLPGGGFRPNPDYFTTALFQRLVGTRVLGATVVGGDARAFAFCDKAGGGGAVVMWMSTADSARTLALSVAGAAPASAVAYVLTSCGAGLASDTLCLNGARLSLGPSWSLPPLAGKAFRPSDGLVIPAQSYGFVTLPGARLQACAEG